MTQIKIILHDFRTECTTRRIEKGKKLQNFSEIMPIMGKIIFLHLFKKISGL